jgi:hypothetical protein
MKKSKYLGMRSGDYVCTGVVVTDVQPKYCRRKVNADGTKAKTKSHHSQQYGYNYEKLTSDGKAIKSILLNASQARNVYRGLATVNDYAKKKELKRSRALKERVSYCFCD